jgi:hypothetical protein
MATLTTPPTAHELPFLMIRQGSRADAWSIRSIAAACAVFAVAIAIRTWNMNAIMATSDQAAIAWMVRHSFGFKWIFAHDYGPVLPLVQRTWAELLSRLHLPIEEAAMRAPILMAGLLQLVVTFCVVRRLGRGRSEAGLAALVCALIPSMVSDARYAWGYNTLWLLAGTAALWGTLAYLQEDRPGWLLLAGVALLLHCLGNCFAFALPVTLLFVWARAARNQNGVCSIADDLPVRSIPLLRSFLMGFIIPCMAALAVIGLSWWWTGGGQLGRLAFKHQVGSTGLRIGQLFDLPAMWVVQFGYLFAVPAAAGLTWATFQGRHRVLAVWCWASLLPMMILVDWSRVGYPAAYLLETTYAAGLLGTLFIAALYRRLADRPVARAILACGAALAVLHMGIASVDACLNHARLTRWTGVPIIWGSVRPETGIKAAGWYVRKHVPAHCVVMATHTNTGMEVPVAEFYCGRAVLADYDLPGEMIEPLVHQMQAGVDVIIVDPEWCEPADNLPGFERVATFRHHRLAVRHVYARAALGLPRVDEESSALNLLFDAAYRCRKVPQVRLAPPGFEEQLGRYQQTLKSLRIGVAASSRIGL